MKVLHIATTDYGGAAQGLLNLHEALIRQGVDSKVLVAEKRTAMESVYQMEPNYQLFQWSKHKLVRKAQKILRRRGKLKTTTEQWFERMKQANLFQYDVCYTSPYTHYDITQNPLVKEADIIHLHWVGNFLDFASFFKEIDKPVVWTLRDENPGLGGFHYTTDKCRVGHLCTEMEEAFLSVKRNAIAGCENMTLVTLSDGMTDFCRQNKFLSGKRIAKIYNAIDGTKYNCIDKTLARQALRIEGSTLVVSFVSVTLGDSHKGLSKLMEAVKYLDRPVKVLCVGMNNYFTRQEENVICYGKIENSSLISLVYSASDFFISPSIQESFGKTVAEAMMCGVPVIATPTGIAPEVINETTGVLLENSTPKEIAETIEKSCQRAYDRGLIRENALGLFNPTQIAKQHIDIYQSIATA